MHLAVPNQRAAGSKLINVPMKQDFIELINESLPALGYSDRSSFIRDAIIEKLDKLGVKVPAQISTPRPRVGKAAKRNVRVSSNIQTVDKRRIVSALGESAGIPTRKP